MTPTMTLDKVQQKYDSQNYSFNRGKTAQSERYSRPGKKQKRSFPDLCLELYSTAREEGFSEREATNIVNRTKEGMAAEGICTLFLDHPNSTVNGKLVDKLNTFFYSIKEHYRSRKEKLHDYFSTSPEGVKHFEKLYSELVNYARKVFKGIPEENTKDIAQQVIFEVFNSIIFTFKKDIFYNGGLSSSFNSCLKVAILNTGKHFCSDIRSEKRCLGELRMISTNYPDIVTARKRPSEQEEYVEREEGNALLEEAVIELESNKQRETIRGRLAGLDHKTIAEQRGITEYATRMQLLRAKKNVRRNFKNRGLTESDFFQKI